MAGGVCGQVSNNPDYSIYSGTVIKKKKKKEEECNFCKASVFVIVIELYTTKQWTC